MGSTNNQRLIDNFISMALDARNSGTRILRDLQKSPPKLFKKTSPDLALVLSKQQGQTFEDSILLANHAEETAMYFFLKRLEEGEGGFQFTLTMRDVNTGESVILTSPETPDLNLRAKMLD